MSRKKARTSLLLALSVLVVALLGNHAVTGECPRDDKNLPRWSALEKGVESPPAPDGSSPTASLFLEFPLEQSKRKGSYSTRCYRVNKTTKTMKSSNVAKEQFWWCSINNFSLNVWVESNTGLAFCCLINNNLYMFLLYRWACLTSVLALNDNCS